VPFASRSQQRWMFANHPDMAERWAHETPSIKRLPERKAEGGALARYAQGGPVSPLNVLNRQGRVKTGRDARVPMPLMSPVVSKFDTAKRPKAIEVPRYAKGGSVNWPDLEPEFARIEREHGLPSGLLKAVATTESAGNPRAVSAKGAQGLFQFMPECVTLDTECLTEVGWKHYSELALGERIFTFNLSTRRLELQRIQNLSSYEKPGELLRMHSKSFDFVVTPNHKWVSYTYPKDDELRLTEARDLMAPSQTRIVVSAPFSFSERQVLSDEMVYLLGVVFADGSIGKGGRQVDLYQKDKVEKFAAAVEASGLQYFKNTQPSGTTRWCFTGDSARAISKYLWVNASRKRLPLTTLLLMTERQAHLLWEALLDTDASVAHTGYASYSQSDQGRASDIQTLLFLLGKSSVVRSVRQAGEAVINGRLCAQRERYQGHVKRRSVVTSSTSKMKYDRHPEEPVWCPTTENGTWVARRNGIVSITGNTAKRFGLTDPFEPVASANAAGRYLKALMSQFNDIGHALAGYNWGEGNASEDRERHSAEGNAELRGEGQVAAGPRSRHSSRTACAGCASGGCRPRPRTSRQTRA
jgi:hypothetical protein